MAIDVGKVIKDRLANLTPEQRAQFRQAMSRAGVGPTKSWAPPTSDFDQQRERHRHNPRRCEMLHDLYKSIGAANDAIMAGDRNGYERELNKQVTLRGQITDAVPSYDDLGPLELDLDALMRGQVG